MPQRPGKVPSYCHYRRTGQAVVRIVGRDRYLGPYGSSESHERYERLIAEWRAQQPASVATASPRAADVSAATIDESILKYDDFASGYFVRDGRPTKELVCMRSGSVTLGPT